jgi:DNA-binding NtrC family response regulator
MDAQITFLLVSIQKESLWVDNIVNSLTNLGKVKILSPRQAIQSLSKSKYNVVIIDAGSTDDERLFISRVRNKQPQTRVVVITASPTWRRAREVFQLGALDYISKAMSEQELLSTFKNILSKSSQVRQE